MSGEIVGRDAELAVVDAFIRPNLEASAALVLEGEPGIGKSTLWRAAIDAAGAVGIRSFRSVPAETETSLSNVVLGDLFADLPAELLATLPGPRRRAFDAALLIGEGAGAPADPRALGVAVTTIVDRLTADGPIVLAIDDDQWIDRSSASALAFALRRSTSRPVRLLLARRTGTVPSLALEDAVAAGRVTRVRVGSLSAGALHEMVRNRLGLTLPRPALLRIHEVSGGNPFFALELARARSLDPSLDLSGPLPVPTSLAGLLRLRLDELAAPTRDALLLVAAYGRTPVGLLSRLGVSTETIAPARSANIVDDAGQLVSFTHPLLAAATYQAVDGPSRADAHRRLASVIDDPVERGRHLALGADGPSDAVAAALDVAAESARERRLLVARADLAEQALRLTPPTAEEDRHRRAIVAARALLAAGEAARGRAIVTTLVATEGPGIPRAESLLLAAMFEDPAPSLALQRQALGEASAAPALRARIHASIATIGRMTISRAWAERHALAAWRLAESVDDDVLRANAMSIVAIHQFERGESGALGVAERAYEIARRHPDPDRTTWPGDELSFILAFGGDTARARIWLEPELEVWRDRDESVRCDVLWSLAYVEFWSGRWSIATEYAEEVLEVAGLYGETSPDHLTPALIALHRGQFEIARQHSRRAFELARGHLIPQHAAILGACDAWTGSLDAGLAGFERAEAICDERGWDEPNLRWWRAEQAETLLRLGRVDDAERLLGGWEADGRRLERARVVAMATRARGLIAASRGDLDDAAALLDAAATLHTGAGDPFGRGRALLALGSVRRRSKQKRSARIALEASVAAFDELGAAGWAAEGRIELARIGGRTRTEGLSPSEQRVAALVAQGRTNREIGAELFLGERTVASHLTHIYAKLGIRSRTELTRTVLDHRASAEPATNIPTS